MDAEGRLQPVHQEKYDRITDQVTKETAENGKMRIFLELDERERATAVSDRPKLYSKNA